MPRPMKLANNVYATAVKSYVDPLGDTSWTLKENIPPATVYIHYCMDAETGLPYQALVYTINKIVNDDFAPVIEDGEVWY